MSPQSDFEKTVAHKKIQILDEGLTGGLGYILRYLRDIQRFLIFRGIFAVLIDEHFRPSDQTISAVASVVFSVVHPYRRHAPQILVVDRRKHA